MFLIKEKHKYCRSPCELECELDFKLRNFIAGKISAFSEKKPFKVLDLGCGAGVSLSQLKKKFGGKLKTVGLTLEKPRNAKYPYVDRLILGSINEVNPREKYELIYSFQGALAHTNLRAIALQKAIEWLKPGGTAALDIGIFWPKDPKLNEIKTTLRQNGIKDYKLNPLATYRRSAHEHCYALIFKKPVRKLP